jgi:hypothetical protein
MGERSNIYSPMLYKLHRIIATALLLISPARIVASIPVALPVAAEAHAQAQTAPYTLTLDTHIASAVSIPAQPVPNFDTEVVAPLKAVQAEATAKAKTVAQNKALAVKKAAQKTVTTVAASGDLLAKLRYCEAGGIYTRNSGNGYYGAYQYNLGTWGNYGGYARPDLAPAAVQDEKAQSDISRRGWSPWPTCARRIGAM